ncbi:hypothetical protein RRG08_063421 [Elysia crispata]|uniref:Uncharacterized protein n=1 Tax=Elysia crispata TaxID=231223 RepID=A0AAE1A9H8_9GAST|nr:hypothetical protein RRG08_063421 [Elysia crispata]
MKSAKRSCTQPQGHLVLLEASPGQGSQLETRGRIAFGGEASALPTDPTGKTQNFDHGRTKDVTGNTAFRQTALTLISRFYGQVGQRNSESSVALYGIRKNIE